MTLELQKRISHAENFSTDLVHEIRNPLASLKSASEILSDTKDTDERLKLIIDSVINSKYLQKDDLTIVVLDSK